jgi:predicted HicB family RNase H-like nuclease
MMDILTYKGYIGTVHFSSEDDVFYGKIEGIRDLVSFEGQSVDELKKAFQEAVEDYLEFCKQIGKRPEKSYKGSFNIRISPEIHRQAIIKATMLGISLNQLVQKAIEKVIIHPLEISTDIPKRRTRKHAKVDKRATI